MQSPARAPCRDRGPCPRRQGVYIHGTVLGCVHCTVVYRIRRVVVSVRSDVRNSRSTLNFFVVFVSLVEWFHGGRAR